MGYTNKAISGFGWQTFLKLIIYLLSLIKIYFLARLLTPADFGLFSLTAVALGLSEALTETGVNLTILQSKQSVKYFLNTAWVISIFRGLIIGTLMLVFGIGMQYYFDQSQLLILTAVAAIIPVIKGFINPYIVMLHKKMLFFQDAMFKLSRLVVEILGTILFGFLLHNAFALILGLLLGAFFEVGLSFLIFKTRPKFTYLKSRAQPILQNAKFLSISSVFNYLVEHVDDFLIGKITGTFDLGIYHNAYSLTHKANYQISKSVHHGIIPILTKIKQNQPRLKKAFFKSFLGTFAIITLVSTPFLLFPEFIVTFLLGQDWLPAIAIIRPLIAAGIIQSLTAVCYTLFLSIKKFKLLNIHLLLSLTLMIGLMIWQGQQSGLEGAVTGLLWSRILAAPIAFTAAYQFVTK
jgi:lipopolysaccharide exporter